MGGGRRENQVDQRFDQGTPEWTGEKEKEDCEAGGELLASYGPYGLWRKEEGIELRKDGEIIGAYSKVVVLDDNRALLKLDKGMLLEVEPEGLRELLTKEKSILVGLVESDGSLTRDLEGKHYYVRFGSESDELLDLFRDCMVDTYGLTPGKYQSRRRKHFFEMIKGSKEAVEDIMEYANKHGSGYWEVPAKYMDKEAARAYLKAFMGGDGSVAYYPGRGGLKVRFFSKNREGLEGIRDLLEEHFDIASKMYPRDRQKSLESGKNELRVCREENMIRYITEVGSFKKSHQDAIERFNKDREERFGDRE